MRSFIVAAVAAVAFASLNSTAYAGCLCCKDPTACTHARPHPNAIPHCTHGVPCGHSCIAKGKVCHVH
jgi:hypothetical protein